jgi:hypothetical protein
MSGGGKIGLGCLCEGVYAPVMNTRCQGVGDCFGWSVGWLALVEVACCC